MYNLEGTVARLISQMYDLNQVASQTAETNNRVATLEGTVAEKNQQFLIE